MSILLNSASRYWPLFYLLLISFPPVTIHQSPQNSPPPLIPLGSCISPQEGIFSKLSPGFMALFQNVTSLLYIFRLNHTQIHCMSMPTAQWRLMGSRTWQELQNTLTKINSKEIYLQSLPPCHTLLTEANSSRSSSSLQRPVYFCWDFCNTEVQMTLGYHLPQVPNSTSI